MPALSSREPGAVSATRRRETTATFAEPLPVSVRAFTQDDAQRWDAYVHRCPQATFFHLIGWRAMRAMGWTGAHRTLKSYMQSRGIPVTSVDGFPEFFAEATKQRRGQWRSEWTSRGILNYFRTGYGMKALP